MGDILVIGAGVIGLTTANLLSEKYNVKVFADHYGGSRSLASEVAGALWEWPPSVCGRHTNTVSLTKSKQWCMDSYHNFRKLAQLGTDGVSVCTSNFLFHARVDSCRQQYRKMKEIEANTDGFRHDPAIINELGIKSSSIRDAYQHLAPVIDTDSYMSFLKKQVQAKCELHKGSVSNILREEESLLRQFNVDVIVNCTGLGSAAFDPTVYPLRGALIRVVNDGSMFPKLSQSVCVSLDGRTEANDMIFIVPRSKNILVVGGFVEEHKWETNLTLDYPPVRKIWERCTDFYPQLKHAKLDDTYPLAVGLRPFRLDNIRVEREENTRIIHNYGHGGAGFSLSFGCAKSVVTLVDKLMEEAIIHKVR